MSNLEHRIETLEKVNRRWRYATVALAGVLLIALVGAAKLPDEVPDLLQARRIEVLRPDGKPGIVLEAKKNGSKLSIRAWAEGQKDGNPAVKLEANENASGLRITTRGKNGERAIGLSADEERTLFVMTGRGERLLLAHGDDKGSSLTLYDGRQRYQKPTTVGLSAQWSKEDKMGMTGITLGKEGGRRQSDMRAGLFTRETDTQEGSYLQLGGDQGKTATVYVNQQNGKLVVVDQSNKGMWTTP